jgi:hypothetical protein
MIYFVCTFSESGLFVAKIDAFILNNEGMDKTKPSISTSLSSWKCPLITYVCKTGQTNPPRASAVSCKNNSKYCTADCRL